MKKGLMFLIFLVLFSVSVYSQSETVNFNGTIPNLNVTSEQVKNNIIDLSNYFSSNNTIEYKFKAGQFGLNGITVNIDMDGTVDITATTSELKSIIFIGDDDITSKESNEVSIFVSGGTQSIDFSPNTNTVSLTQDESKIFAVSTTQSVEWFLDNVKLNHTQSTYSFSQSEVRIYNLKAKAGNIEKTWSVSVLAKTVVNPTIVNETPSQPNTLCGNKLRESGEDCSSCPEDVACSVGAICQNGICIPTKTSSFSFSTIILWIGLFAALIVFIVVSVILFRKKDLWNKIFKKREKIEVSEKVSQASMIQEKPHEVEDLTSLINYFKENLFNFKKEVLIQEALKQGWTQEQIDRALSQIGKENGQNKGNQDNIGG